MITTKTGITRGLVDQAVLGGAVLGGGGGGHPEIGRRLGYLAVEISKTWLVDSDDLPEETWLLMVSLVGAPAARTQYVEPAHFVKAVRLVEETADIKVGGLITNEAGGLATINGWFQAALLGLPVVDAPGNGRAHPTGVMGSMGLEEEAGYVSIQAAVGGDPESSTYVEMTVRGDLTRCASLVRQASVQAGGMVAVARNPVSAGYARKCGAVGAIRQAIRLGEAMSVAKPLGGLAVAESAARFLGGRVLGPVKVSSLHLTAAGGFDLGKADLIDLGEARSSEEALLELTFLNEYMTLEKGGKRLATFPDLLTTLETKSGTPLSSAELQEGQELFLLVVPKKNLILGSSLRNRNLYSVLEEATGKEIVRFLS